jgi:hypothetical protein
MAEANKVSLFTIINRAEVSERIPRVPGAFHFALPFEADAAVDWAPYFDGGDGSLFEPRAFLVSRYEAFLADGTTPNAKAGLLYPTDLTALTHAYTDVDPEFEDAEAAAQLARREFLGVIIDGADYKKDLNFTVTLAAGIPAIYLQGSLAAPSQTVDAAVVAAAPLLGLKFFHGQVFWNKVQ